MKRGIRTPVLIALAVVSLVCAAALIFTAMRSNLVFFYTPTDLMERKIDEGQRFRVGGLVEEGSLTNQGDTVSFTITDGQHTLEVSYKGMLPDLFREGQGVVAEGRLAESSENPDNPEGKLFKADTILAKHDEEYMAPEVSQSLKETGYWEHTKQGDGGMPDILQKNNREDAE